MGLSKQMVCNPKKGSQARRWANVSISQITGHVASEAGLSLRLSSQLMSGTARIYSFQFHKLAERSRNVQSDWVRFAAPIPALAGSLLFLTLH